MMNLKIYVPVFSRQTVEKLFFHEFKLFSLENYRKIKKII